MKDFFAQRIRGVNRWLAGYNFFALAGKIAMVADSNRGLCSLINPKNQSG